MKRTGSKRSDNRSIMDHSEKREEEEDVGKGVQREGGLTGGTIRGRISVGEMKDSHYLLLIKERMRDRNWASEREEDGRVGVRWR